MQYVVAIVLITQLFQVISIVAVLRSRVLGLAVVKTFSLVTEVTWIGPYKSQKWSIFLKLRHILWTHNSHYKNVIPKLLKNNPGAPVNPIESAIDLYKRGVSGSVNCRGARRQRMNDME